MVEMKRSATIFYFKNLFVVMYLNFCPSVCFAKGQKMFQLGKFEFLEQFVFNNAVFVLFQGGIVSNLMEATNERPWLWVLFIIVIILPFVLIAACCFPGSKVHAWVNETCNVLVYSCFVTIECALTSYFATQY